MAVSSLPLLSRSVSLGMILFASWSLMALVWFLRIRSRDLILDKLDFKPERGPSRIRAIKGQCKPNFRVGRERWLPGFNTKTCIMLWMLIASSPEEIEQLLRSSSCRFVASDLVNLVARLRPARSLFWFVSSKPSFTCTFEAVHKALQFLQTLLDAGLLKAYVNLLTKILLSKLSVSQFSFFLATVNHGVSTFDRSDSPFHLSAQEPAVPTVRQARTVSLR